MYIAISPGAGTSFSTFSLSSGQWSHVAYQCRCPGWLCARCKNPFSGGPASALVIAGLIRAGSSSL
eukprot:3273100-Alexandrium_andersonii.AAC.1